MSELLLGLTGVMEWWTLRTAVPGSIYQGLSRTRKITVYCKALFLFLKFFFFFFSFSFFFFFLASLSVQLSCVPFASSILGKISCQSAKGPCVALMETQTYVQGTAEWRPLLLFIQCSVGKNV